MTEEGMAGRPCQPKNVPLLPGLAWDTDGDTPGVIVRSVAADPLRGERCPHCRRAYGDGGQATTTQPAPAGALPFFRLLVDLAREHKIGRDLQVGRWVHLLAFYLGLLPECRSDAALAKYLRVHPATLSESKKRLPLQFQVLCHLLHKPRKPHGPELQNSAQGPDSRGDPRCQHGRTLNCSA